jgi:cell division transport system permease protein
MPIKVDYVVRETTSNLGRNLTMAVASIMTVAVSLGLVGASLMFSKGVDNATQRWKGGIEFVVFLRADATDAQQQAIDEQLKESPEVQSYKYVDQQDAYEEFKRLFADSQEMIDSVQPEDLPPSFRVQPVNKDADSVESLASTFQDSPGVKQVVLASKTIQLIQDMSRALRVGMIVVAIALLVAAGLLILNTIRMAMYARRREIEVMKLVGATNWFIRVPFMLEGLVQGLIGALVAVGVLVVVRPVFLGWLPKPEEIPLVSGFTVSGADFFGICLAMGVVGAAVGTVGAGIAVTRFLDV